MKLFLLVLFSILFCSVMKAQDFSSCTIVDQTEYGSVALALHSINQGSDFQRLMEGVEHLEITKVEGDETCVVKQIESAEYDHYLGKSYVYVKEQEDIYAKNMIVIKIAPNNTTEVYKYSGKVNLQNWSDQ